MNRRKSSRMMSNRSSSSYCQIGGGLKNCQKGKLNKLKRGKRDGTPEKSNTPSQDALPEEGLMPEKKAVIINDEILALQIKQENLEKMREPRPPTERKKSPVSQQVIVRKLKPASEWNKPPPRIVTVARPAPTEAPLKPIDYSDAAGLRFDEDGKPVAHSILGSVEDYTSEAVKRGDLPPDFIGGVCSKEGDLTVKYEKKPRYSQFPKFESVEESNALKNWQKRMMERRNQQDHLARMLDKAPEQLVMNQADTYRKTQERRYIIDRTIPTMDYGKGYRIGSEFWKQQERVGDDLTGIHMTLAQTEKGYPPPIEHVGVPHAVLQEKGTNWDRPRTPFNKPWHRTAYLGQRQEQLQPVMNELDPYNPDLLNLQIVGSNRPVTHDEQDKFSEAGLSEYEEQRQEFMEREQDMDPLADHPDVYPEPVFGPSLKFAGQSARWTGDSSTFLDQTGIEARVSFEAYAGDRVTSFLEIVNDGTTCIYYDWKKVPKNDPFNLMAAKVQRFYFNTSSGVILPGDAMKFPFVFKSPNAGVFSEQWRFQTKPVVCGGAALVVTLRGVALQKDKYKKQRTELEQELSHKQAEQIVTGVLDAMLEGLRTPPRPSSPIDAYITEEEVFSRKNPGLHYSNELVTSLKALYKELHPDPEPEEPQEAGAGQQPPGDGQQPEEGQEEGEDTESAMPVEPDEWDLSVDNLKEEIMGMDEENENKQELLQRLNTSVIHLSFPPFTPKQQSMYTVGYQMMCELVDGIVGESVLLRTAMGMPEKEMDEFPDEPRPAKTTSAKSERGDGKKKKDGKATPSQKPATGKDAKSPAKPPPKDVNKGGKITPAPKRTPSSREKDRPSSAHSGAQSPLPGVDPILEAKYKDKIYTQSYMMVHETVDKMLVVFEDIQNQEGGPTLPVLT